MDSKKLDFVFFDAGGGHRSAATALKMVLDEQNRPWDVRLVNLQELLDPLDLFRKLFGVRLQDVYNLILKNGWTLGSAQLVRPMQWLIRLYHERQVPLIEARWRESRPDLVVSFVPHFNRALRESLRNVRPEAPFVTVLTDLADYPPHFWIERQDQFLVCGSNRAVEQARDHGHPDERIFRTSGMILHPRFYQGGEIDRVSALRRLGLDSGRPTGLVLFGGQGSSVMRDIALRLDRSGLDVQLILICGRNARLAGNLRRQRKRIPMFVEGFTTEVPFYMRLADFFIGKPGPGSISEALALRVPVIVERNAWTLPQERYNAEWLVENQVGEVVRNFRSIDRVVANLLGSGALERFRRNAAKLNNRAVFEIPELLDKLLRPSGAGGPGPQK